MIIVSSNPRILRREVSTKAALSTLKWFCFRFKYSLILVALQGEGEST
jgi:hypothetical protein